VRVFELLDFLKHLFAIFVKVIIDYAMRFSFLTKDLRRELAELPSVDFDNWPGEGVRATILAALYAKSSMASS